MLHNVNPNRYIVVNLQEKEDRTRALYFPIARAIELENLYEGTSLLKLISDDNILSSFNFICTAYWVGLKTDDPSLTLQKTQGIIGKLIENAEGFQGYMDTLTNLASGIVKALQATGLVAKVSEEETSEGENKEIVEGKSKADLKNGLDKQNLSRMDS